MTKEQAMEILKTIPKTEAEKQLFRKALCLLATLKIPTGE